MEEISAEIQRQGLQWPLLRLEMFDGSEAALDKVKAQLDETATREGRRRGI